MASPIPFIQNVGGKFQVTDDARTLLNNVRGKLAIVCVAGPYRTGKSFLLNTLVGKQESVRKDSGGGGFQVGGSVRACTKGIWLWGEPVKKGEHTYLFMDSEGLGSTDQHITFDTQILSLAILLSSYFILNTQGTITEQTLSELELVVKCSERIRATEEKGSSSSSNGNSELADIFPDFLWVLRDFALQLQDENENTISPKEYLENSLRTRTGAPAEKNRIRDAIKNVFRNRDCRTLVRPITEEDKLQKLSTMPWKELRQEFRTQVDNLCQLVYSSAKPKKIEGGYVNGSAVIGLAEAYVHALNTGKMPVIHTAWQSVVMQQSAFALDSALQVYEETFARLFAQGPVDQEKMFEEFRLADEQAMAKLKALSVGDESQLIEQVNKLVTKATTLKKSRADVNALQSRDLCSQLIESLWQKSGLEGKDFKTAAEFETSLQALKDAYYKQARGPSRDEIARVFFEKRQQAMARNLYVQLQQLQAAHQTLLVEKKAVDDKLTSVVQQAEAAAKQYQQTFETERRQYQQTLETERKQFQQNIETDRKAAEATQKQYQQALETKDSKLEALQSKYQALQEESHKAELEHSNKHRAVEKETHELALKLDALNQAKLALEKQAEQQSKELKQQLKEMSVSLDAARQSHTTSEQQVRAMSEKLKESEQLHKAADARVREDEKHIRELNGKLEAMQRAQAVAEKEHEARTKELSLRLENTQKAQGSYEKEAQERLKEFELKLKQAEKAGRETNEHLQAAEGRNKDVNGQLQDSRKQLEKAHANEVAAQEAIRKLDEAQKKLLGDLNKARSVEEAQSQDLESAHKTIKDLQGELAKVRGAGESKSEEVKAMQKTAREMQEAQKKLTSDLTKALSVIDAQKEELSALRSQAASSEQGLQKKMQALQEAQKKLTSELSEAHGVVDAQKEELSALRSQAVSSEQGLQKKLQALQEAQKKLTSELSEARGVVEAQKEELEAVRKGKAVVEQDLLGIRGQFDKVRADLDSTTHTAEAKVVRLERQLAQLEKEKATLATNLERQSAQAEQEKNELSLRLSTKLKEHDVALSNERAQYEKKLAQQLEAVERQNQVLLDDMKQKEDKRITELERSVEELQKIKNEKEETVVQKLLQIGDLEKELTEAKLEYDHFSQIKSDIEQLTKEKRELSNENAQLKASLAKVAATATTAAAAATPKRKSNTVVKDEPESDEVRFVVESKEPAAAPHTKSDEEEEEEEGTEAWWATKRANIAERRKRQSVVPPPKGLKNPEKCTVAELMSWLTSMDVALPGEKQKKQFYLELLYKAEPELRASKKA